VAYGELTAPGDFGPKYHWQCPRCKFNVSAWTENGLRLQREPHQDWHYAHDLEQRAAFREALAAKVIKPADYNRLHLNWEDITFLITRGIRIDEDVIFEPEMKYKANHDADIKQTLWAEILERAWGEDEDDTI
jgi:hypothetical protein